jgi:hypothetical protein
MAGACLPYNSTTPHIFGTPCECESLWTPFVDFQNLYSECYSLPVLYSVWSLSFLIALTNGIRLAYCLFWFIWQRRHHACAIWQIGAFQVLVGFFVAAAGLASSAIIKLNDMQHTLLGYDTGLTIVFMSSVSISFLSFVRSHWSYIHITLATGLVAAAHRQSAVTTVRAVLVLDVILFAVFPFVTPPIALLIGSNNFLAARWLLLASMAAFWFHSIISIPLFFYYGALVRTIDQGLEMKKSDPAMLDLRGRLQSLRRRQFSTIIGALVYTTATHASDDVVIATWAYAWPASHLLIGIGLTGYAFFYWSPSTENLGIRAIVVAPLDISINTNMVSPHHRGDAYLLNSPISTGQQSPVNGTTFLKPNSPSKQQARITSKNGDTRQYHHPDHRNGAGVALVHLPLSPKAARAATISASPLVNINDHSGMIIRAAAVTSPSSDTRLALNNALMAPQQSSHTLFTRTGTGTATTRNHGIGVTVSPISRGAASGGLTTMHDHAASPSPILFQSLATAPDTARVQGVNSAPDLLRVVTLGGSHNHNPNIDTNGVINGNNTNGMINTNNVNGFNNGISLPLPSPVRTVSSMSNNDDTTPRSPTAIAWQ